MKIVRFSRNVSAKIEVVLIIIFVLNFAIYYHQVEEKERLFASFIDFEFAFDLVLHTPLA